MLDIEVFSDTTLTQVALLLLAFVLSALIGVERELYHTKSAANSSSAARTDASGPPVICLTLCDP